MAILARVSLALLLVGAGGVRAQDPVTEDRPALCVPLRPLTKLELREREALEQYALGLLCEHDDRLLEARNAFEKAADLNPKAGPVLKALIPIYLALDRGGDALTAAHKVLALNDDDSETWYLLARLERARGKGQEAVAALRRAVACTEAKERPELSLPMYHDLGALLEAAKEPEQAAAAFGEAVKILEHPDTLAEASELGRDDFAQKAADTYERIGRVWLQAHKADEAVAAFRKAQAAYPAGAARLSYNLAQVHRDQGKPAAALAQLDAYLRLQPQAREAYEMKIALLGQVGRANEIVPWLEKTADTDRRNVGVRMLLAQELARAGQPGRAEGVYKELAEHSPSAEVYRGLFRLYKASPERGLSQALGLLDHTLEQARKQQKGLANDPSPAQARAMLAALREDTDLGKDLVAAAAARLETGPALQSTTLQLLAALADRGKQLDEAERFYRRAITGVTPDAEAMVYGGLLRVLWKAHKYEAIVQVCRDGLRVTKPANGALLHSDLARALARLGKVDEAVTEADAALRQAGDADRLMLRQLRVRVLMQAGRHDQAEADCLGLLKELTDPGDVLDVRYLLSNVYSMAGNYPKAEEQLQWMLQADASCATACNDLGYLWADRGKNLDEAEKLIRKALELDRQQRKMRPGGPGEGADQDTAAYVDSLGWVLFRKGRHAEALKELERAVVLPDGDDPVLWDHLGEVRLRLHQVDGARAAWREALRLYEQERRRDRDERYQDLQRKLKLLETETP
jgi:tetratricopeptide (TPR) repeat protein